MVLRIATLAAVIAAISIGGYEIGAGHKSDRSAMASVVAPTLTLPESHPLSVALNDGHTDDSERAKLVDVAAKLAFEQHEVKKAADEAAKERARQDDAALAAEQAALERQLRILETERNAIIEQIKRLTDRAVAKSGSKDGHDFSDARAEIEKAKAEMDRALKTRDVLGGPGNAEQIKRQIADAMKAVRDARSGLTRDAIRNGQLGSQKQVDVEQLKKMIDEAGRKAGHDDAAKQLEIALKQRQSALTDEDKLRVEQALTAADSALDRIVVEKLDAEKAAGSARAIQKALIDQLKAAQHQSDSAAKLELKQLRLALIKQNGHLTEQMKSELNAMERGAKLRQDYSRSLATREGQVQLELLNAYNDESLKSLDSFGRARVKQLSQLHRTLEVSRGFALMVALNFRQELGLTSHQTTELQLLQADFLKEFAP